MRYAESTPRGRLPWVSLVAVGVGLSSALAVAAPSAEAPGPSIALLPIEFVDPLPEADRAGLEQTVWAAFDSPDVDLVHGGKVERARERSCPQQVDEACLRAIGTELGVTHVVTVEVRSAERDFEVVLRALSTVGERSPSEVTVECPVCGIAEVSDSVAAQAAVLRARVIADVQPGRLVVEGTPKGATIRVDGRAVGALPFESGLGSGEHEVLVSERGYYDTIVPVQIVAGAVERVRVDLEAAPEVETEARWRGPFGWAALGLGVAGVGAGAGLLVLDGRPHARLCDDTANVDINGACKWIYHTQAAGNGLLVGGIVAAGVGVPLVVLARKRSRSEPATSSRSLDVRVGLGRIEFSGRF